MTLQQQIIEELKVVPSINAQDEIRRSIDFLKDYAKTYSFVKGFVLGISGGQDSTLVGKLAQLAVDELNAEVGEQHYNFYAVRLPYGVQFDEADCNDALAFIKPSVTYTVNIKPAVDASVQSLQTAGITISDFTKGNEKARERMKVQFSIAATKSCFGTESRTDFLIVFKWLFDSASYVLITHI